jgi:hypothetical protein
VSVALKALPGQWAPGFPFPEIPIAEAMALVLEAACRDLSSHE